MDLRRRDLGCGYRSKYDERLSNESEDSESGDLRKRESSQPDNSQW